MRFQVGNQTDTWFNADGTPNEFGYERLKQLMENVPDARPLVTAGFTLTKSYNGVLNLLDMAAGGTCILPPADGSGNVYLFLLWQTVSSNTIVIKVANASDSFIGFSQMVSDDSAAVKGFIANPAVDDTITLNGGTKGGFVGDYIEIRDVKANRFFVRITGKQTGAEATMFSATV